MSGLGSARRASRLREGLLLAAVLLVAAVFLLRPAQEQEFTIDESRWIATSRYFWITFVERDLFGPAWQPNYVVLTHPPVARYLIGLGLWLQGWTPDQLNGRYDSLQSRAFNAQAGNIPEPALLAAARRVTYLFAVTAVGLLYVVGRALGGPVAGLVAAGAALASPLLSTLWTRALAESILATWSLLALALALRWLPRLGGPPLQPWLPAASGAALALAAATKLSGGLGALGLGLFALVQQGLALARTGRTAGLRSWVDCGLAAVVLFVAVNPLLYVSPAERAVALVQHRQEEMRFQQRTFSDQAVPDDSAARVSRVARRLFVTYALPRGPLPWSPDLPLVVAGLAVVGWRSVRELRAARPGPSLAFGCWLGTTYLVTTRNLGFDSSHYYAPLATLNAVLIGLAASAAVDGALRLARRWGRPRGAAAQKTQAPAT